MKLTKRELERMKALAFVAKAEMDALLFQLLDLEAGREGRYVNVDALCEWWAERTRETASESMTSQMSGLMDLLAEDWSCSDERPDHLSSGRALSDLS